MENHGLKIEHLENKNYYMHIKNYVNRNGNEILINLVSNIICRKEHAETIALDMESMQNLRKDLIAFERLGNPPFSTHNMDEQNNQLIVALKQNNLLNRKEDVIKVLVEPVYLDGNDGFIDLTYYDALVGCHLGIFPSYYEPWGYTPLESIAVGIPALTTDLSGFGLFVKNNVFSNSQFGKEMHGVYLLERLNRTEDEVLKDFVNKLYEFTRFDKSERVEFKLRAKNLSEMADWKIFVKNYVNAHNIALNKVGLITDIQLKNNNANLNTNSKIGNNN
jgi:glycogen(starch) synthase